MKKLFFGSMPPHICPTCWGAGKVDEFINGEYVERPCICVTGNLLPAPIITGDPRHVVDNTPPPGPANNQNDGL